LQPDFKKYIYIQDITTFEEAQALALKIEGADIASYSSNSRKEQKLYEQPKPVPRATPSASRQTRSGRQYPPRTQELNRSKYANIICNYCGKMGHTQRICWDNPDRDMTVSKSAPPRTQQLKEPQQ